MDINALTLGQIKDLVSLYNALTGASSNVASTSKTGRSPELCDMIGQFVIVRTYSAGVWFGKLAQKDGNEVILDCARRMWRWQAAKEISLSACALYGVDDKKSQIVAPVSKIWLEAIEIIPCEHAAIVSIGGAPNAQAQ